METVKYVIIAFAILVLSWLCVRESARSTETDNTLMIPQENVPILCAENGTTDITLETYSAVYCDGEEIKVPRSASFSNVSENSDDYNRGGTDALETFVLLNLELSLTGERKTFGEMSDIVRERLNAEKPEPQTWVIQ